MIKGTKSVGKFVLLVANHIFPPLPHLPPQIFDDLPRVFDHPAPLAA